jgi:peptidylprolyl isomerase/FKBP-type peptidyl-prolyl cis-trans isomerase FkpA
MDTTKQVIIETLIEGQGEESKKGDTLVVHYTGTFENGEKFDSSLDRGESFSFILGQGMVIEGWEQGMLGMKAGEKRKIFIPYELGYGEFDYGPIPGKSNLIFEVELLEIK